MKTHLHKFHYPEKEKYENIMFYVFFEGNSCIGLFLRAMRAFDRKRMGIVFYLTCFDCNNFSFDLTVKKTEIEIKQK